MVPPTNTADQPPGLEPRSVGYCVGSAFGETNDTEPTNVSCGHTGIPFCYQYDPAVCTEEKSPLGTPDLFFPASGSQNTCASHWVPRKCPENLHWPPPRTSAKLSNSWYRPWRSPMEFFPCQLLPAATELERNQNASQEIASQEAEAHFLSQFKNIQIGASSAMKQRITECKQETGIYRSQLLFCRWENRSGSSNYTPSISFLMSRYLSNYRRRCLGLCRSWEILCV